MILRPLVEGLAGGLKGAARELTEATVMRRRLGNKALEGLAHSAGSITRGLGKPSLDFARDIGKLEFLRGTYAPGKYLGPLSGLAMMPARAGMKLTGGFLKAGLKTAFGGGYQIGKESIRYGGKAAWRLGKKGAKWLVSPKGSLTELKGIGKFGVFTGKSGFQAGKFGVGMGKLGYKSLQTAGGSGRTILATAGISAAGAVAVGAMSMGNEPERPEMESISPGELEDIMMQNKVMTSNFNNAAGASLAAHYAR